MTSHVMRSACAAFFGVLIVTGTSCTRSSTAPEPTAADAKTFLDTVDQTMNRLCIAQNQAGWVAQTFITDDTEAIDARETQELIDAVARFAKEATRFDEVEVPPDQRRQLNLLKVAS